MVQQLVSMVMVLRCRKPSNIHGSLRHAICEHSVWRTSSMFAATWCDALDSSAATWCDALDSSAAIQRWTQRTSYLPNGKSVTAVAVQHCTFEEITAPSVPRIGSSLVEMRDPLNALLQEKSSGTTSSASREKTRNGVPQLLLVFARDCFGTPPASGLDSDHDKLTVRVWLR